MSYVSRMRAKEAAAVDAFAQRMKPYGLKDCEKRIKAYADKHHKGLSFCVIPTVAEDIIREFYGLPGRVPEDQKPQTVEVRATPEDTMDMLNLASFFEV